MDHNDKDYGSALTFLTAFIISLSGFAYFEFDNFLVLGIFKQTLYLLAFIVNFVCMVIGFRIIINRFF